MNLTILLISSEKVLSPLFEDSGSESSTSLLSEDEIKPRDNKCRWITVMTEGATDKDREREREISHMRHHCRPPWGESSEKI